MRDATFAGEVQFAGYADSSRSGPRITLRLADRDDLERFVGLEGRRFMVAMVLIADDESPDAQLVAQPVADAGGTTPKGGELARLAGRLCASPNFWRWARDAHGVELADEQGCAGWMRGLLGIESRAQLDHDAEAAALFHTTIRRPFAEWARQQGIE